MGEKCFLDNGSNGAICFDDVQFELERDSKCRENLSYGDLCSSSKTFFYFLRFLQQSN